MSFNSIIIVLPSTLIFFLAFIGDKAKNLIQLAVKLGTFDRNVIHKNEYRWDSGIYGHRFLIVSLAFMFTIAWHLDRQTLTLPWGIGQDLSHSVLLFFFSLFIVLWMISIFLICTLHRKSTIKNRIINTMGIFGYVMTVFFVLRINL